MSSDSEIFQELDQENMSRNIIAEVKKRPALYDQSLSEYNNRHDRRRLWQEVYKSIFKDWDVFSEEHKILEGDLIQKKWKNIKDSFLKELAYQKGKTHKKKRKYIHYDSLLFLLPSLQRGRGKLWSNRGPAPTKVDPHAGAALARSSQPVDEDNSTEHKLEEMDEEKHFALMLVPMLRKLDDDQKHYAKIEILNVLHKARSSTGARPAIECVMMETQSQAVDGVGNKAFSSSALANNSDFECSEIRVKEEKEMTDEEN